MKKIYITLITFIIIIILTYKGMPILSAKNAFKKALNLFDIDIVVNAEKIFRLETNNFLSNQFTGTFSPGMEPAAGVTIYPFGWKSLKPFWDANPNYRPTGLKNYTENGTGIVKPFIKFPSVEAAVMTVCTKLEINGNNPGAWFSNDSNLQSDYETKLSNINPSFTYA